jgi:hypothetical protein
MTSFMGVSSVRFLALIKAFFGRPLDTKIITAGVGITHVDIGYIAIQKQPLELGFNDTVGNIPLGDQSAAPGIGVEREAVGEHVRGKASIFLISVAVALVDEDGPGQRKVFLSVERVVGEQYPAFCADGKGSQALPARPVTGGHFGVSGMTVAG